MCILLCSQARVTISTFVQAHIQSTFEIPYAVIRINKSYLALITVHSEAKTPFQECAAQKTHWALLT